jgi:hypothetical protein
LTATREYVSAAIGAALVLETASESEMGDPICGELGGTARVTVFDSVLREEFAASRKLAVAWFVTGVPAGEVADASATTKAANIAAVIRRPALNLRRIPAVCRRSSLVSAHGPVRRLVRG